MARYQNQARAELPGLQKRYATLEAGLEKTRSNDQNAINANTGILAQLSALSAAGAHNFGLLLAQLTVAALFFLIEMLPVGVKFLLNLGPLSTYETVAKLEEEKIVDKARLNRVAQRRSVERESDEERKKADAASRERIKKTEAQSRVRINVAEDMSRREETMSIHANGHVAGKMEEILDAALQEWSAQVRARLNAGPAGTPNTSSDGQFAGDGRTGAADPDGNETPPGDGSSPPHQTPQTDQGFGLPPDKGML